MAYKNDNHLQFFGVTSTATDPNLKTETLPLDNNQAMSPSRVLVKQTTSFELLFD